MRRVGGRKIPLFSRRGNQWFGTFFGLKAGNCSTKNSFLKTYKKVTQPWFSFKTWTLLLDKGVGARWENPPSMRDSERDSAGIVPFQGTTSLRFKLCMFPILERQSKRYLEKPKRERERESGGSTAAWLRWDVTHVVSLLKPLSSQKCCWNLHLSLQKVFL